MHVTANACGLPVLARQAALAPAAEVIWKRVRASVRKGAPATDHQLHELWLAANQLSRYFLRVP